MARKSSQLIYGHDSFRSSFTRVRGISMPFSSLEENLDRRLFIMGSAATSLLFATGLNANVLDGLGLTKTLGKASDGALDKLAQPDAFYRDTAIRILLPGATGKLASKLMGAGDKLGLTNKLTKSLNDAASLAAGEAKPIFRNAISSLKLTDVPGIALKKDGATSFLKQSASADLLTKIRPLVGGALGKVGAYDQMTKLSKTGGLLSALGLTNDKLIDSVSNQALNGIFSYIGKEEASLRGNPLGKILG
jgi:hypothetical protein